MVFGKTALFWKNLKNTKSVQCELCPHFCVVENGEVGKCKVRMNVDARLVSLVYNKPCSISIDPIEKKPLYHFLPSSKTLSVATVGCNLDCDHCQNFEISQFDPSENVGEGEDEDKSESITAKKIVDQTKKENIKSITYTYTEPTIFYEYMKDIAILSKKEKRKNITVTNGFINPEPLKQLCNFLDASNIDLKSIENEFYEKICKARLNPVLEAINIMKQKGVWIEITNLIIPGKNDHQSDIRKLVIWIKNNLGVDVPLHFTAFYPTHRMQDIERTEVETLKRARKIAMNEGGLNYVYTGNVIDDEGNNTYCPNCKKAVIVRNGFEVIENNLTAGICRCGKKIPGVWE